MGKPNQIEQGVLKSKTKQRGSLPRVSKSDTNHQTINTHDGEKKGSHSGTIRKEVRQRGWWWEKEKTAVKTKHHNLTQNGGHRGITLCKTEKGQSPKIRNSVFGFCKTKAGYKLVNNTDQARVPFTSKSSVAQVVGEEDKKPRDSKKLLQVIQRTQG